MTSPYNQQLLATNSPAPEAGGRGGSPALGVGTQLAPCRYPSCARVPEVVTRLVSLGQGSTASRPRRWLLLALWGLAVAGGFLGGWGCRRPVPPLAGHLTVTLRSAHGGPSRSLADPGAVPAGHGDLFTVDARLSEPAFIYLVWLSADARIVPLYPWNDNTLEVHDVASPPPTRRPTHFVMCPAQSSSWTLGQQEGTETLLLLARRQPLSDAPALAKLLAEAQLPSDPSLTQPQWVTLQSAAPNQAVTRAGGRHDAPASPSEGGAIDDLVRKLGQQFELVQAVQFPHRHPSAAEAQVPP